MTDFLNLQFNGLPVVMYSMAALTTGVLAYATAGGEFGKLAQNAMASLMPPQELIDNAKESAEKTMESASESVQEATESVQEATESVKEALPESVQEALPDAVPEEPSSLEVEKNEESPNQINGGKRKRNKKTPRNKKTARKSKKRHSKKPVK